MTLMGIWVKLGKWLPGKKKKTITVVIIICYSQGPDKKCNINYCITNVVDVQKGYNSCKGDYRNNDL